MGGRYLFIFAPFAAVINSVWLFNIILKAPLKDSLEILKRLRREPWQSLQASLSDASRTYLLDF